MGDIADMMLDGTLCEQCGECLGVGDGFPAYCRSCKRDADKLGRCKVRSASVERNARQKKTKCPDCGKKVKEVGLSDHLRDSHNFT